MSYLYLLRHGRTDKNQEGEMQSVEIGELNEVGIKQLKQTKPFLENLNISKIYSSDAIRCKSSVKNINKDMQLPVEYTVLAREKDNGDFAKMKVADIDWSTLKGNFDEVKPPNGESLLDVKNRAEQLLKTITPSLEKNENILIVSHGGFIKVMMAVILDITLQNSIFGFDIDNSSVTTLKYNKKANKNLKLVEWNRKYYSKDLHMEHDPYAFRSHSAFAIIF